MQTWTIHVVCLGKTTHAGAAASTTTGTFAVSGQRIAPGKLAIALGTYVRLLAGVEFAVTLQIMETPKPHVALLADIRLLLAMREEMAL
ncbi:hypothetical protein ColKHC_00662 [Colletotrichum higginsianum]|nr:hypothetical protein ColKHC_00662 [Colletotrichum higginsianum]